LVKFDTKTGRSLLFDIRMSTGNPPPMASEVLDEHGQLAGYHIKACQHQTGKEQQCRRVISHIKIPDFIHYQCSVSLFLIKP
ncbi:hypothetical protein, partial [Escherichia coli]|uniref:hypothetical protein n=1 Tax=Escherichia coli TaxID=562 RepID=UPI00398476DC